jgi:hypothetical protein
MLLALAFAGLGAACGSNDKGDPVPMSLTIEPADASVTITDGVAVKQDYKVTVTYSDGNQVDVSQVARLELRDPQYGTFTRSQLEIGGGGAGPTRVVATVESLTGDTGLTVYVKRTIVDPGLPAMLPGQFEGAIEDPTLAPAIQYPADKVLVAPNIGSFDVHWTTANTNVFQLRMYNEFIDVRRYTTGLTPPANERFWTAFAPTEWYPIASTRTQLKLELAAMSTNDPTKKGTAGTQTVEVTNENTRGGIYYWTTTNPASILRYDVEKPGVPPSKLFEDGTEPGGAGTCHGCHTLSKDGTKLAMTLDGGDGRGVSINVANRALDVPVSTDMRWNFATFTPDATKLLTVFGGAMTLRDTNGGAPLATIPNSAGTLATHPEISPDGSMLVNAECAGGPPISSDAFRTGCGLVTRPFNAAANTAGAIKQLVAAGTDGLNSFYPSISPDGKWIAFSRSAAAEDAYDAVSAETWVMKADGSAPPIKLAAADLGAANRTNSWPRWVPFGQTFGPTNEPLYYLTFSSMRKYGVRLPTGGRPQIWMTPFFPARAELGQDPTGPSFRLPFQSVANGNHIAQWTQAIVVIE